MIRSDFPFLQCFGLDCTVVTVFVVNIGVVSGCNICLVLNQDSSLFHSTPMSLLERNVFTLTHRHVHTQVQWQKEIDPRGVDQEDTQAISCPAKPLTSLNYNTQ